MTSDNALLDSGMQTATAETYQERLLKSQIAKFLERWGGYDSIQRMVRKYGKLNTIRGYLADLDLYFDWLENIGVGMNPDELILDNLRCVFESSATEVNTKITHMDLLDNDVNVYLLDKGLAYPSRHRTAAAVREFYKRNNAPLFGDFWLADGKTRKREATPSAADLRAVIGAMPIHHKTPLMLMWQSGAEPAVILGLKWGDLALDGRFSKITLAGRKKHKQEYFTLLGKDSITLLKIWRQKWVENVGRQPNRDDLIFFNKKRKEREEHGPLAPGWLNLSFKRMAVKLFREGLVSNGDPDCWHVYSLRHSFKTEAEHIGIRSGIVEFFMGHIEGIKWRYDNRDQLHPGDFEVEYAKLEPYLSLNPSELVTEERVREEFESRLSRLESQIEEYASKRPAEAP